MDTYGQLIITGIKGKSLLPEEINFIQTEKIGGIVLYSHNFQDPAQLAELVNSIQKIRDEYPLFIATNHEAGLDFSFKTHFTQFPSMHKLAEENSPKMIFEVHEILAKEMAACGINLSFSPCCDILINADNKYIAERTYGNDADKVEKNISAAIRGLQTNKILACAKHFPGQGNTSQDPRFHLPLVKTSLEDIKARDIIPFVKASKSRTEFMMMGHLLVDAIDDKFPATLSSKVYSFLRNETKFSKIVVTDDMCLKAVTEKQTTEEAALMAINAGADVLLYSDMEEAKKAIGAIKEAVKKRSLKKELLLEKLSRVERCKKEYLSTYQPIYIPKVVDVFHSLEAKKLLATIQTK